MPQPIIILNSQSSKARIILITVLLAALLFGWFGIRWQLGDMLAELTTPGQPNAREIADLAAGLAPGDPLPVWLAATKEKENFSPENIDKALRMFEDVVRLSPYDYRWWIELGRAYEQAEKPDEAEKAFQRAVDLAPAYTFPHWQFGNFYLRQNRTDEAFAELTKTTEKSYVYRDQVFSLAWDYFDKDPAMVEQLAANTPDVRASLAQFFAVKNSPADALRIWNTLSEEEKARHPQIPKNIAQGLHDRLFFRQSVEFAKQAGIDSEAAIETISNSGFETFFGNPEDTLFGWKIYRSDNKLDIAPDTTVKHEGSRSLKAVFKSYVKPELYNIVQVVAVQPLGRYRVSFWLRTENLRSGGMPLLQVTGGKENSVLAASEPFPIGSLDWQEISVEFTVPEDVEGISLSTSRVYCGEGCPISGTFWYDDFRLSKQ